MQKVVIKKEACVGCGLCVGTNPDYFVFSEEGLAEVSKEILELEDKQRILESVENCPTEAILIEEEKIAE